MHVNSINMSTYDSGTKRINAYTHTQMLRETKYDYTNLSDSLTLPLMCFCVCVCFEMEKFSN